MHTPVKRLATASLLVLGLAALCALSEQAAPSPAKPTIVLVHDASTDASRWSPVAAGLLSRGYRVVVTDASRGVGNGAADVASLVGSVRGHVVLVGHSHGGAVISRVGNADHRIKALVFVSAFALETGESAAELVARFPDGPSARLPPPAPAADPRMLHVGVATGRPVVVARDPASATAGEPAGTPTWASTPSWFIYGGMDRHIPPAALDFMARRARSRRTVVVDGASDTVMISDPYEVVRLILQAAESP